MKALIFIPSLFVIFGIHGAKSGEGWYIGGYEESCDTACQGKGLVCTKEGYKNHHTDVGSSAALLDMITKLGGTTSDKSCELAHFSGLPVFKSDLCAYSNNPDLFDCSKQPHPRGENRRRICYCEPVKENSGNNEVVEVLYREVGRTEKPDYSTDCSLIPSSATYIKLVMGNVVDYYRPIAGKSFCEMLLSNKLHQWSSDGLNWVTPAYISLDHLGGSAIDWPSDGRKYLSFWGSNIEKGGCCITEYNKYDGRSWMLEFSLYYVSGLKPPVLIECAGKQCGEACSEGICDGNGGCVSPDYNPCAVHGCDEKECGESCLSGDIMGICNKDGECNIETNSVICDEPEPPTKPTTCDYGQYCALVDCTKTGAADLCPDQCNISETCNDGKKNQGETGRDCGGPCPDCEYYQGEVGQVCNNEDDVIRNKEECQTALEELAKQMNIHKHTYWEGNKKNIPSGCSIRLQNNRLHFNTIPGFGKGRAGQVPICKGKL